MSVAGVVILVAIALVLIVIVVLTATSPNEETPDQVAAWERARASENSLTGRILNSVARPVSRLDMLHDGLTTKQYRWLESRLLASGKFGLDVEVFLSVQVACFFVALGLLALAFLEKMPFNIAIGLLSLGILAYPWNVVSKAAAKRADAVSDSLPEFAELLQMSISGGMGLESALAFTAERVDGPVSDEVVNMLTVIRNNPADEAKAYVLAGERLGTPEAKTFFASLLQAQMEGAKLLQTLAAQAKSLRISAFQRQRAEVKKLPVKLVVMFGLHLLPLLFAVALWPTLFALSKIGG